MIKKSIVIVMIIAVSVGSLTACAKRSIDDRKIIKKDNKQIVVLSNQDKAANNEVALEKIDNLKDIRAIDWIDENTLLIMKENESYPQIQYDTKKAYPKNLYEYDINTQKSKLIAGSETDMSYGTLSTDKQYIFYKEGTDVNLTGFILNRITGQKFKVSNIDSMSAMEGNWIDNNAVIFSEFPQGGIYIADINGKVKAIENSPKGMLANTVKLGDKVFYTTISGKLYVQNVNGEENKFLKDNIIWLIPSPAGDSFIMVKRVEKTKMVISEMDLEGNEKKILSEGTQIFGTNWSPDGSKIAYSVATDNNGKAGLYVTDIKNNKDSVQLTVNLELVSDPIKWSPSGNKLLATNNVMENNEPHFTTHILHLK
jgi:TolB protein